VIGLELGEARVLVRPGATDMRKQINGLALIVQEQMEMDPSRTRCLCSATGNDVS